MYTETLMQHAEERRYLPAPWQEASTSRDWHLRLTPKRAERLVEALAKLIDDWREDGEDAADTGSLVVNLNAFPRPGTVVLEGED